MIGHYCDEKGTNVSHLGSHPECSVVYSLSLITFRPGLFLPPDLWIVGVLWGKHKGWQHGGMLPMGYMGQVLQMALWSWVVSQVLKQVWNDNNKGVG